MGRFPSSGGSGGSGTVPTVVTSLALQVQGDITLADTVSTSAEIAAATGGPGTGGFDLSIAAVAGDVLSVSLTATGFAGVDTAINMGLDIATIVSGSPVHWLGQSAGEMVGTNDGLIYVKAAATAGTHDYVNLSANCLYVVQAGDLSAGKVTLRPYYGAAAACTLGCSVPNSPFILSIANFKH